MSANPHYPRRRHLRICPEESWGTPPPDPDPVAVPLVGDGFSVRAERDYYRPHGPAGLRLPEMLRVEGELLTRPYPELTGFLLNAALARQDGELPSYSLEHFSPADRRRVTGARIRRLVLSAGSDGALLRVAFVGAGEQPLPSLTKDAIDYCGLSPAPFRLRGADITAGGRELAAVEEFNLTIENDLTPGPNRGGAIGFLAAGARTVRLRLTAADDVADFHDAVRSGDTFPVEAALAHPQGHTLELSLPAVRAVSNPADARPGRAARAELRALADADAAGNDLTYTVHLIG